MHPQGTKVRLIKEQLGGNIHSLKNQNKVWSEDEEIYGLLLKDCYEFDQYVEIGFENETRISMYKHRVEILGKDCPPEPPKRKRGHFLTNVFAPDIK